MKLGSIIDIMNRIAPVAISEDWDNCGLQVGDTHWDVKRILIALDASYDVVNYAIDNKFDLLITHHPMIFSPVKSVDFGSRAGSMIYRAAVSKLSVFSAHTNFDSANGGMNDILSKKIGLKDLSILSKPVEFSEHETVGLGRTGFLPQEMTLSGFIKSVVSALDLKHLRYSGNKDQIIRKVAVCSGSGASLIKDFLKSDADVYVTGDIKYHEAQTILDSGKSLIDIGHFASESIICDALKEILEKELASDIEIESCKIEKDPFNTVLS